MANSFSFLCSSILLIVLLSYADGQWNYEPRYYEPWNNEPWNNRLKDERWNDERRNNERYDGERWDDEKKKERLTNERWNGERQNNDRWDDKISNNERWNDERRNNGRENGGRLNNERRNGERSNDERWNNERRNGERSNDERRNGERSNNERRNGEKRNNERRNGERSNDERRNDERFAEKCPADQREDWSYRWNNGPLMWPQRYPTCGGRSQSPIPINSKEAIFDDDENLKFNDYNIPIGKATIENDGHTIQMTPRDNVQRAIHYDSRTYRLNQLHFHWGDDRNHGSEHTIDNTRYALEMHLVHQSGDGETAVVAVFFKEQSQTNKDLQNIIQNFPKVMYKDNTTELKSPLNLNNFLPANPSSYYSYEGSLTTPPCTEGVQWLLLPKIIPVGTKQMTEFRKLYSSSKADSNKHCKISNNYRPLQPLNGRKVVIYK